MRTPGDSRGGSAAAVAASRTALDIGSDIKGSIRVPAHFCGVHGLKPADHLVSSAGHIPGHRGACCDTWYRLARWRARSGTCARRFRRSRAKMGDYGRCRRRRSSRP